MIKLMIGLLIIACIAPLFIKGPDGEPIMTLDDWSLSVPEFISSLLNDSSSAISGDRPSLESPSGEAARVEVYKWQDEEGVWQFSDAPVDFEGSEKIEIGDVNVMDPWSPPAAPVEATGQSQSPALSAGSAGTLISTSQMQEMMDTVNNLQETIDERKADMDAMVLPPQQ